MRERGSLSKRRDGSVSAFEDGWVLEGLGTHRNLLAGFLWTVAVLSWGVGDWATTTLLWSKPSTYETTRLVVWVVGEFGHAGHAVFKVVVLGALWVVYRGVVGFGWRWVGLGVPAGVSVGGVVLTVGNLALV